MGPDSASADPGPVCYGRGGTEPTVTDADLLLGYLDPEFFLGGRMALDPKASMRAVKESIADPLAMDWIEAAWGIHRVVNENMAAAARIHGIERGKDLRSYPLFAFGGAGPVHAWEVARILGLPRLFVPVGAGANSAFGLLSAPLKFDFVRTAPQGLKQTDWNLVTRLFSEMEDEGRTILADAGITDDKVMIRRSVEMRYLGQGHEVEVPVPAGILNKESQETLASNFEAEYRRLYGRIAGGVSMEALNWRLIASGPPPRLGVMDSEASGGSLKSVEAGLALKGERPAYFGDQAGFVDTPVYDRYQLEPGMTFEGPFIMEETESTLVVGSGSWAKVNAQKTLIVELTN